MGYSNYGPKNHQVSILTINSECPKVWSQHWCALDVFWRAVFWLCIKSRAEQRLASHLRLSGWESPTPDSTPFNHRPFISLPQGKENKLVWPRPSVAVPTLVLRSHRRCAHTGSPHWPLPVEMEMDGVLNTRGPSSPCCLLPHLPHFLEVNKTFRRVWNYSCRNATANIAFQKDLKSNSKVLNSSDHTEWDSGWEAIIIHLCPNLPTAHITKEMLKFFALKPDRLSVHPLQQVENMLFLPITRHQLQGRGHPHLPMGGGG